MTITARYTHTGYAGAHHYIVNGYEVITTEDGRIHTCAPYFPETIADAINRAHWPNHVTRTEVRP